MAGLKKTIKDYDAENESLQKQYDYFMKLGKAEDARDIKIKQYLANQKLINELVSKNVTETSAEGEKLKELETRQKDINSQLEKESTLRKTINTTLIGTNNFLKKGWDYLISSDKAIRQTIISLGLSGSKAELMRTSFENSARAVAKMGGSLTDIQSVMQGYADETGRARAMSAQMVEDIV